MSLRVSLVPVSWMLEHPATAEGRLVGAAVVVGVWPAQRAPVGVATGTFPWPGGWKGADAIAAADAMSRTLRRCRAPVVKLGMVEESVAQSSTLGGCVELSHGSKALDEGRDRI